jgi:magnesium-transporting ATPase (P-type)
MDYRNDERELHQRDHAHFQAYRVATISLVIVTMLLYIRGLGRPFLGFLSVPADLSFAVTIAALFVSQTLPQAILLWTEPDMEEPQ